MKTNKKLIVPVVAILLQIIPIGAHSQLFKNNMKTDDAEYTMPGYYKTYDDFAKGNITKEPIIVYDEKWYPVVNGKRGEGTKFKENKIWGYVDKQGFSWYLDGDDGWAYRILVTGKIWVYTDYSISFTTDDSGKIQNVSISSRQGDSFKQKVRISAGPGTEIQKCTKDNLLKLLADDADISAKVKKKGIYEQRDKKWVESLMDVLGWAQEYNDKHKS